MNKPLKLIPIGNSTGVVIPKDILRDLGAEQGDTLIVTRTPNGIELRAGDLEFEADMEIMRDVMRRRRSALRELAK
jgi:putative addiction module antidote